MINLIFPPAASPTCVPLGVSFLKAHIDSKLGSDKLEINDLNIKYWDYLCQSKEEYLNYQNFARGNQGPFTRDFYEPYIKVQTNLKIDSDKNINDVLIWLDKDVLSPNLKDIFLHLLKFIPNDRNPLMFSTLFPDQLHFTLGFTKWLNQVSDYDIYVGGASVLIIDPYQLMELAYWLEGVFVGEGEFSMEQFIEIGPKGDIPGLYKRDNNSVVFNKPLTAPELSELEYPDFSWANLENYFNPVPVLPIQFSRGCKWRKCRFCAHNFSFGKYRCIDPVKSVDMLAHYKETLGVTHFYVTDQYLDGTFLEPFAKELLGRNLNIRYTFMGRPAEDMTFDILNLLSKSGCRWISWGVESGNQALLDIANKGTNPKVVSRVLMDSHNSGIKNQALMIFGLPGTNNKAAEETYNFLQENSKWIHSHTASEFQLYSGTPFGNNPEKYGVRITGKSVFCKINGFDLDSVKKEHTNAATEDEPEILRGPLEAKKWKRRKIWLYTDNFWNSLPSEHYLILTAAEFDMNSPINPLPENRAS